MSLPDELIISYFEYLTDTPDEELAGWSKDMETGTVNPMNLKKELAWEITRQMHSGEAAEAAQANFETVVQRKDLPTDMPEAGLAQLFTGGEPLRWSRLLVDLGLASSATDAKRLISQNAVEIIPPTGDSITLSADTTVSNAGPNYVIKVGKRRFVRLVEG